MCRQRSEVSSDIYLSYSLLLPHLPQAVKCPHPLSPPLIFFMSFFYSNTSYKRAHSAVNWPAYNLYLYLFCLLLSAVRYDFIEIRDGTSENADVLGRHCSNIAPPPIISSGSSLQIRFVSDYAHQGAGFSLRYEIFKTGEETNPVF